MPRWRFPRTRQPAAEADVLLLGKGWFPDELGGLDRYFSGLYDALGELSVVRDAVVLGPAASPPAGVRAPSSHDAPLPVRLLRFAMAARTARPSRVVHAHFALYALPALIFTRLRRRPLVVQFQGPWADEAAIAGDRSRVRVFLRRRWERLVYRRADVVLVLSTAFKRVLVEQYGVSPWRVRRIRPGVDERQFNRVGADGARARLGVEPDAWLAVSVRRLVPRMGLADLIDAWGILDVPAARLWIAGDGPERQTLQDQIDRLGLGDAVRLLGRVDDETLRSLYQAADVNVVPTRAREGFGLTVIEAAACGTPSIVTSVDALPEVVADLDRSLVVAPRDPAALAARVRDALDGSRPLPSAAAAAEFAARHSWRAAAAETVRAYEDAASPGAGHDRRRVVYLDHHGLLSGGEIALERLLRCLPDVEPHVILGADGPFARTLMAAGVSVEVLPMRSAARDLRKDRVRATGAIRPGVAWAYVSYVARLSRRLRQLQPDLVHTNSLKSGVYGSVAGRLVGVPVVWHVRDRIAEDYLPRPAVRLIRRMTRDLAAAVVANSKATIQTLAPQSNPTLLYSIVPEVVPSSTYHQRADDQFRVAMVGRFASWKGQEIFVRAFAQAFPDGSEEAVLVGAALFGEDDYVDHVRAVAAELGVQDRVAFRGFREDVPAELARADVLVHASITPEPFGQVIVEAMACGVPVICTDVGGPAEFVSDGVSGLLYPPGDVGALADALRNLRDDPDRRQLLAANARQSIKVFSPASVRTQMMAVYDQAQNQRQEDRPPRRRSN